MHQLRNIIGRTNVPLDPQKNMNAAEDFMMLLLHAHIVAAAEVIQSQNTYDDVVELARAIVSNNIHLPRINDSDACKDCEDKVCLYATELLSLAMMWHGFHDSIREGDGERILRYWKVLLVVFKSTNHHNYAKEAVNILFQYYHTFSDRQKAQLLWSRCINTRGSEGANIPCDLFMEHLNRRLKNVIRSMGANVTPKAIVKAGKAIGSVHHVCQVFEEQTATSLRSDRHTVPPLGKDFLTVLRVLKEEKVFLTQGSRQHVSYKFTCTILQKHSKEEMKKKIERSLKQFYFI